MLNLDGFTCHKNSCALQLLNKYNIVVVSFPAHKIHHKLKLGYCIFSPLKAKMSNLLSTHMPQFANAASSTSKYIYTLYKPIHDACKDSITYRNIFNGFKACSILNHRRGVGDFYEIQASNNLNIGSHQDFLATFISFKGLVTAFFRSGNLFRSNGDVQQNGSLVTISGALLFFYDVFNALKRQASEKTVATGQNEASTFKTAVLCKKRG